MTPKKVDGAKKARPAKARGRAADVEKVPSAAVTDAVETRTIDLDAARRARREARGDQAPPHVVLDGERYELPPELPADALTRIGELVAVADLASTDDDVDGNLRALAGFQSAAGAIFGPAWDVLATKGLSLDDLAVLIEGALAIYGVNLPE